MDKDNATVIIDLDISEKSSFDNTQHLFHRPIYERVAKHVVKQLKTSTRAFRSHCASSSNGGATPDAILLHGERGVGKTSILFSLRPYMQENADFKGDCPQILFLDPVDPTLLNDGENFLNIVVSEINRNKAVVEKMRSCRTEQVEAYYRALEELASALENEQLAHDRSGLDRLMSYQGGLGIAQLSSRYFDEVLRLTDTRLIVLAIDDVDMSLDKGFDVLEVIRKFLCSPSILPLVSGDFQLYNELMTNHFADSLERKNRSPEERRGLDERARVLATEYLRKVFPLDRRHAVPGIERYFDGFSNDGQPCKGTVKLGNEEIIDLKSLGYVVDAILNATVNGEENSRIRFRPETARRLMQFVRSVVPPLKAVLDKSTIVFESLEQTQKWWSLASRDTVVSMAAVMASYFEIEMPQLSALCNDLVRLNTSHGEKAQLSDLRYLHPVARGGSAAVPERDNENFSLYLDGESPFSAQRKHLPEALQKHKIPSFAPVPAFEPIDGTLKFVKNYRLDDADDDERFFVALFSTTDFYTSYQTARLIFFGRFFELVTTSLFRDIDEEWLQSLLSRSPYFSILQAGTTKTYDWDDGQDDADESSEGTSMLAIRSTHFKALADEINTFRRTMLASVPAFVDLALLSAVQSKYFNQINLFKRLGHGKGQRRIRVDRKTGNARHLLAEVGMRALFSYWSSVGSFEAGKLYFGGAKTVSHTNFSAFDSETGGEHLHSNASFHFNIHPFLDLEIESSTKVPYSAALRDHPVFLRLRDLSSKIRETAPDVGNRRLSVSDDFWNGLDALLAARGASSGKRRNDILRSIGSSLASGKRLDDGLAEWVDMLRLRLTEKAGPSVLTSAQAVTAGLNSLSKNRGYNRVVIEGYLLQ